MGRKYQVISSDGHLETPPDPWVRHVPEKYRERAPRLIHLPDGGGDAWIVEGRPLLHTGQNVTGPGPVRFGGGSYTTADGRPRPGTGDAVQRLHEQDQDGIDAEVLFPPVFATRFIEGLLGDRSAYLAIVRAYNTFLAEDFCAVAPDRLIGNAFVPVSGIDDAVAELEFAKSVGLRTVVIQQFPNGGGTAKPEDDRFWAKSLELGVAISPHVGFGDPMPVFPGGQLVLHDKRLYPLQAGMAQHSSGGLIPGYTLAQLIVAGVFDRFPALRLHFAETNASMLPAMLYYLDRDYTEYNDWFQGNLQKLPSEYCTEHCLFGMIQEVPAIKAAAAGLMPLDWLTWGSDFPHSVGTFPNSQKYIREAFADLDESTRRKILLENPAEFYGLDLTADITETPA